LYVKGKYSDAKIWLKKALDNGGSTNGTILEHYGDVMYKLGDENSALDFWKKAFDSVEF
jgi:tetratricopeptide (TPR) repeat protein